MDEELVEDQIVIDRVVDTIDGYSWTWPVVKDKLSQMIVDMMPSEVLIRLTDDPEGFKKAEKILLEFYFPQDMNTRIISDAFDLCGQQTTLYALEGFQLDQIPEPTSDLNQGDST